MSAIQRKFDETRAAEAKRIAEKGKPGHVATAADRAKDPYLSADSIIYEAEAAKHTPGPWIVDDRHIHPAKGLTYPPGVEPETDVILLVDTDQHDNGLLNETDKANLRLAAAAPELLEAFKAAVERMEAVSDGIPVEKRSAGVSQATHVRHMAGHLAQHAKIARAAIAKAEGRQA